MKNINPDKGSAPAHLTVVGSYIFFRADDGERGLQLWVSNGTEEGTAMLRPDGAENDALEESFWEFSMTGYDGALYLAARYDDAGLELWRVSVPD